jgi:hypothetical protein
VDEAGQVVEAEGALVALRAGLQSLVLVGDHKQLPATVFSQLGKDHGCGPSAGRNVVHEHNCQPHQASVFVRHGGSQPIDDIAQQLLHTHICMHRPLGGCC